MASVVTEFSNQLADAVEQAGRAVIAVQEGGRSGVSGTVWREGIIVTAEHTIHGEDEVTLVLPSGNEAKAKVAGRDSTTDIAVLRVAEQVKPAVFADTKQLRVGNIVLAIGRRGHDGLSASFGCVSATAGEWRTWQGGRVDRWFRLDLSPYPGFSGGPLIDAQGRVIGVNTSGPRREVLTIPRETVDRVVEAVLQHGSVKRGFLGIGMQPVVLTPGSGVPNDISAGLLVITVAANSPAHLAGLMVGDILIRVDGKPAASLRVLQRALDPERVGSAVDLELLRGGSLNRVQVKVGTRNGEQ